MMKGVLGAFLMMFLALSMAEAQTQRGAPETAGNTLTAAEADHALSVLTDADKRAQLIETLQSIAKASAPVAKPASPAPAPPPTAAPISLQPDSLGAQLVVQAAGWAQELSDEIMTTSRLLADLPGLSRGALRLAADPYAQSVALDASWRLALVLAFAIAVERLVALALRRPLSALEFGRSKNTQAVASAGEDSTDEDVDASPIASPTTDSLRLARRVPLALLRLTLSLLPVAAFGAAGVLLLVTQLSSSDSTRLLILEALKAYVLCRAIIAVAKMLASSSNPRLRLVRVGDQTAAYIEVWVRRIAVATVVGATIAEMTELLGGSPRLHHGLVKIVAFVLILFLLTIVLQCRVGVARRIRAGAGANGNFVALRNRLADTWHVIAIAAILTLWFVWAVRWQDGLSHSLQLIVASIAVMTVARLCAITALGLLDRLFRINSDLATRFPGLEERADRYYPLLRAAISLAIVWMAAVAVLEVWGVGALAWFQSGAIGGRLVSAIVTIAVAAAIAALIWEGVNAAMDNHLERLTREARVAKAARLRTLLPIFRSTLLIVILVVVGLTVLSEIGVDIAPLLAGAGIVGIAIGFGSQKLVQDLITGLFLLLENAIQVGDFVTVAGLSGSVENLSIRTMRLRAGDGSVHIVPFSSVTSVTNANRGIGNAAISVSVAYHEDTDRVGQALKQIATEMRQETKFKSSMLGDLQLWGVDKFDAASATLVGQIVCTDSGRWEVQREFNRRMKQKFQELGIVIAMPNASMLLQAPTARSTDPKEGADASRADHDDVQERPAPKLAQSR